MLAKALVRYYFNYFDDVNNMSVKLSEKLQLAQNYFVKLILALERNDHVTQSFDYLSIFRLNESYYFTS